MHCVNQCGTCLIPVILLTTCLFGSRTEAIETLELEVEQDPSYSNAVSISNIQYQVIGSKTIDFSCDVVVKEPLTYGTKVRRCELSRLSYHW